MTEDVRDAVAAVFADFEESGFVESAWVAEDVNLCVGPTSDGASVDVEVSHTHPDVDLQAVADEEPPLEGLDGEIGTVGDAVVAAIDDLAAEPVETVPFALIVDNELGVRCASFRTRIAL